MNNQNPTATLLGLGTANPVHKMSQQEAAEMASVICCENDKQRKLLKALYRKAGVNNRYTIVPHTTAYQWIDHEPGDEETKVLSMGPTTGERIAYYQEHAPAIAIASARSALEQSGVAVSEITHLVTVSCTGFAAPGTDVQLIEELGLADTVQRVNVGFMGCHGAINGLRVAQGLLHQSPKHCVLLSATEVCSMHYRYQWDPERFMGNLLFADGSASLVLGGSHHQSKNGATGEQEGESGARNGDSQSEGTNNGPWTLVGTGSRLFPNSTDAMTWTIGDHGFEMTLSAEVPDLIQAHLLDWLKSWLAEYQLELDDVGTWAVHPGGPRILNSVEAAIGLDKEQLQRSRDVLSEFGNMSSPTVLFILERARLSNAKRPCVMLGFGPGLVAEVALWA